MKEIFSDQLQWVAETSDRVELGLSKRDLDKSQARPLAVRVIVERKAAQNAPWQIVWAADVVAADQELVQFQPSTGKGYCTFFMGIPTARWNRLCGKRCTALRKTQCAMCRRNAAA